MSSRWPAGPRRVLVVGIDGVRLDLLPELHTPHLDAVAAEGFLAPVQVDEVTPTMSGPCWTTIVTGVGVAKHGVLGNHLGGNRLDEEWTVIVVTDHGHLDQGGHGGRTDLERTAWIAASGPGITPGGAVAPLHHTDVAAHVYAALQITPDPHWTLDGRPFRPVLSAVPA